VQKKVKYKRILLKLTGEVFGGERKAGLDFTAIARLAVFIGKLTAGHGVQLAVVNG
jgi:uridylate kinase